MTFDFSSESDYWLQVTVGKRSTAPVWLIALGYPSDIPPDEQLDILGIVTPESLFVMEWQANLSASLSLDYELDTFELADFVYSVIVGLYKQDSQAHIDLALEYG